MTKNSLLEIDNYGQSIWMDYLNRSVIESGELEQMIKNYRLRGITSNPSTFEQAMMGNQVYDADIEAGIKAGKSVKDIYESLIFEDIRNACDLLRPVYEESGGQNGYVSIEVSPHLARDTAGTIEEALQFYRAIARDNVMIKIPGTPEGFPAVERIIGQGINVNITLLFSVQSYENAAWAYIRGLEDRVATHQPIDKLASVASFFLSRIDTKIDDSIDERLKNIGTENLGEEARLQQIKGKVAIANAKIAYQTYQEIIKSDRWQALEKKGANVQRLLWASTSTKNPNYSDVMYVDELIAPNTVNTMPIGTIEACADRCNPAPNQIEKDRDRAHYLIESLNEPDIKIDLNRIMSELLEEGIDKFVRSYDSVLQSVEEKVKQLSPV